MSSNSTSPAADRLQAQDTIEAARKAAAILMLPTPPLVAEDERTTVFAETGAGLVFGISNDGHFTMAGQTRDGRPLVELTPAETRALFSFWTAVCTPMVLDHVRQTVGLPTTKRAQDFDTPAE